MKLIYTLTDHSVTVLGDDFIPKTIPSTHPAFERVVEALKADNDNEVKALMDLPNAMSTFMQGKVAIVDRQLYYDGKPITNALAARILQFMDEGNPELAQPLINFLEKVRQNPSRRAVEGLYDWAVRSNLPITPEGDILAYKIVRNDYKDYHSGNFDNSVGQIVQIERNEVDEDPDQTCSHGLHFCSIAYLPHYYSRSDRRIMVVKIDPADVVAFPRDYNISKGRTYRYEVVGEVPEAKAATFFENRYVSSYADVGLDDTNTDPDGEVAELEVGEYYKTRDGQVVQIVAYDANEDEYPYSGELVSDRNQQYEYGQHGSWNLYDDHALDLIEMLPPGSFNPFKDDEEEKPKSLFGIFFDAFFK